MEMTAKNCELIWELIYFLLMLQQNPASQWQRRHFSSVELWVRSHVSEKHKYDIKLSLEPTFFGTLAFYK